ncbi:MAG: class I SAM-dependent methyltransferase [Proteobacteria bacterium]|nr:class I SAM-dependent methyltransferase [Pseudomonadota bacterium]MDA1057340.1 class I SAM-dependent methyltransferase [Pseudomonadota bacterium]
MVLASPHTMYATPDHDEAAREDFVLEMMVHVSRDLTPGKRKLYDVVVKPKFEKSFGRAPVNRHEIRHAMEQEDFNQVWGALRRTTQELMFDSIGESVERRTGDLMERAAGFAKPTNSRRQGTLDLDPTLEIPRYQTAVDIHCKPGGYHSELTRDDLFAGAEYDRSYNLFAMGASGPLNDDMGRSVARYASRTFADLKPRRILEIGCTVGHSTLPYCDLYPDAEIYAIDVAAPCLRYAHARAESLGYAVHWSQQNGEQTNFPDGHFDLIVSHILFHETSNKGLRNILGECHRLLAKGGAMVHFEAPQYEDMPDPYDHTLGDWSTHYNAEPFWGTLHDQNLRKLMEKAGFPKGELFQHKFAPSVFLEESPKHRAVSRTPAYPVFGARKT